MKLSKLTLALAAALPLLSLVSCASLPTATGEQALAVTSASNAVSAQSVEEVLTQNINIPVQYMLLLMAASTFVPNPFQLVGKAFSMLLSGVSTVRKLWP